MSDTLHIYTRVSTEVQEEQGTSLDSQIELGIDRSKRLGMKNRIWNEGSQSSSKDDLSNRPVLTELLQEIQDGNVKHLYVWNTDRLSRNLETWGLIRILLIKNEVHLHTPTGEMILSDPQTNLMLGIMSEFSQYDNLIRAERFRLGKLQRIREGGWKGGPAPYGYTLIDSRLVVQPDESKWVIKIHEWYRDGYSVDEIKDELLNNGVLTRRENPVWSLGSINALLTNTHYDGYWYYKDKKSDQAIRVTCPRIVSPQLIQEVKNAREKRSYKTSGSQRTKTSVTKHTYLLSKMLVCGECGSFYYGNYKKTQTSYYHCGNKTNKFRDKNTNRSKVCKTKRNVRMDTTEKVVWDLVRDVLSSSHIYKESIKLDILGSRSTHQKTGQEKKALTKKIGKLEIEVQKITDTIVDLTSQNLLSESRDLQRVIKKLEEKRNQVEVEIQTYTNDLQEIDNEGRWVDWLKVWKNRLTDLDSLTREDKHKFLKGIISSITVKEINNQKHQLVVVFLFPWVGDKIKYVDPKNKSEGYELIEGRKSKSKQVELLKKLNLKDRESTII